MTNLTRRLDNISKVQQRLAVRQGLLLEKSLHSNDPGAIIKASQMLQQVDDRQPLTHRKSLVVDPMEFVGNFGYKNRSIGLSYDLLRRMSDSGVVGSIITTRLNQVASFAEPQSTKYSTGFVIRKRKRSYTGESPKLTKQDEAKIDLLTEFMLNCGRGNVYDNDDFDTFVRKYMRDSLQMDQAVFDIVPDGKGVPFQFGALDASTFRIADSYVDEQYQGERKRKEHNYLPNYVQLDQGMVHNEFYPWELCFGVRNPTTMMRNVGYGISENERLINQITSMLWGEEYNRRFFSHGSMPKGFIRVDSSIPPSKVAEFRQQWQAMALGLPGAHRTPILEAGKIDWVDLHKANTDMEYANWIEFNIKLSCAHYAIDPAEVNFPLSGGAEQKAMFEGNNEARLKHSKDKGLYPLLRHLQARINKYLIRVIDKDFEFVFVGMDGMDEQTELDNDIKKVSNLETLNEVRERRGLKTIDGGDIIFNAMFMQQKQMDMQKEMMAQQGGDPNDPNAQQGQQDFSDEEQDPETEQDPQQQKPDPITKAFGDYLTQLH